MEIRSVAVQADAKIVVTGSARQAAGGTDLLLARFLSDGSSDAGFGSSGWVTADYGGEDEFGESLALQADGKIVVAGYQYDDGDYRPMVVRFLAGGGLDAGFARSGFRIENMGDGYQVYKPVMDDGKIVVAGNKDSGAHGSDVLLARYLADGSPDYGFGNGGVAETSLGSDTRDYSLALAIQSDGRILVGGGRFSSALLLSRFWH